MHWAIYNVFPTLALDDVLELGRERLEHGLESPGPEIPRGGGDEEVRQVGAGPAQRAALEVGQRRAARVLHAHGVARVLEAAAAVPGLAVDERLKARGILVGLGIPDLADILHQNVKRRTFHLKSSYRS